MKVRRQSGKKLLIRLFCVMIAVTLVCFIVCAVYSFASVRQEMSYCNEAALDVFCQELEYVANDLQSFTGLLYENGSPFGLLGNRMVSAQQQMNVENNLRLLCRSRTTANTGIYIFRTDGDFSYYCFGDSFLGGFVSAENTHVMADVRTFWEENGNRDQSWTPLPSEDTALLMYTARRGDMCVCVMIDLDAYTRGHQPLVTGSGIAYAFFDGDKVLTSRELVSSLGLDAATLAQANGSENLTRNGYSMLHTNHIANLGIGLCGIFSMTGMWANLRLYSLLLLGAILLLGGIFWAIYALMKRMLIYPLDRISAASRRLASGDNVLESQPETIAELNEIQEALGGLVEQKVSLERESLNQAYQKEHALLQYYQLQTRSHFFLNCLKSIYNMASQGELEKTLRVITLFSNHIRYVFHDSLSLMPVHAELAEVEDYFHIIELERSDHILLAQDVDPELLDFPVPPLVIQTFLENFNKHNAMSDRILRFAIRIDRVNMDGQRYVRLRLSDNGVGYDRETLRSMGGGEELFSQYHVGIQNLCRRMDILYQKQAKIAFYNNPGGGASSVIYLPCGEAVPEDEGADEGEDEEEA